MLGYLNINSLRNKIIDLREFLLQTSLDYIVVSETKLNNEFPSAQLHISDYEIRARRDRNKHGGGLIEFVRKGIICKRQSSLETIQSECVCSELTFSKKKWIIFSIYRPPSTNNLAQFFHEMNISLNKVLSSYDNIIVMGDFNIDWKNSKDPGFTYLENFCDVFGLKNLIKCYTCITKNHKSTIDLILTNKPHSFQASLTTETGKSDYHKLISTSLRVYIAKLKPKTILYRDYKKFDEKHFLNDLQKQNFTYGEVDHNKNYDNLIKCFSEIVEKHAPLKKKIIRGNHAPFMTKTMRKEIYTRSRLRNNFNKIPSNDNWKKYKKQRNKCVKIRRKSIKDYFKKITSKGVMHNKQFWRVIRPFLTNKGFLQNNDITLIEKGKIINDDKELAEIFNQHYINIVETSSGKKPSSVIINKDTYQTPILIEKIVEYYKEHQSIKQIKETCNNPTNFTFTEVKCDEILTLLKNLNIKKSSGVDTIPPKLVKLASNFISAPLTHCINTTLKNASFPDNAKKALVTPLDKGGVNKNVLSNFRPVSVLNCFSKVFELVVKNQMESFLNTCLSVYIGAYRKHYSTQHILLLTCRRMEAKDRL